MHSGAVSPCTAQRSHKTGMQPLHHSPGEMRSHLYACSHITLHDCNFSQSMWSKGKKLPKRTWPWTDYLMTLFPIFLCCIQKNLIPAPKHSDTHLLRTWEEKRSMKVQSISQKTSERWFCCCCFRALL